MRHCFGQVSSVASLSTREMATHVVSTWATMFGFHLQRLLRDLGSPRLFIMFFYQMCASHLVSALVLHFLPLSWLPNLELEISNTSIAVFMALDFLVTSTSAASAAGSWAQTGNCFLFLLQLPAFFRVSGRPSTKKGGIYHGKPGFPKNTLKKAGIVSGTCVRVPGRSISS